ncbi:ferredoxin [Streptomyces sp. NPDC049954]|uniref:ferredoxin n=1 Tax=Streptomyces sp. NPDC049954 TaxID=3155779 RepID=UPI00343FC63D
MTSASTRPARQADGEWDRALLVRYLEQRFACVESCRACARACARHAHGLDHSNRALTCVEICDRTARLLTEEPPRRAEDEAELSFRLAWCREACLDCAARCADEACLDCAARCADRRDPGFADCVRACRDCADACAQLLRTLEAAN